MENRLLNCCFDFQTVGHHFECDRINCKGNHSPEFPVYREKSLGLIVIVLTVSNWVNTGDVLLKMAIFCVKVNAVVGVFAVKCLIYL